MDKQKQIEEMAKSMLEYGMEKYPTENSVFTEETLRKQFFYVFLTYAEHLYNAGYRKIPENAVVLTKEEAVDLFNKKADGFMTSAIGDIPLNIDGMRKLVDEVSRLLSVQGELQELNAKYYNEAKDLGRELKRVRKETAEKFEEEVEMWKRKAIHYYNLAKESGMYCVVDDEICKEITEG